MVQATGHQPYSCVNSYISSTTSYYLNNMIALLKNKINFQKLQLYSVLKPEAFHESLTMLI